MHYELLKTCCLASVAALLAGCGSDGLDVLDIEVPAGYGLSAGTSTIFLNSSVAYDSEAPWVKGDYLTRFVRGDRLYDDVRTYISERRVTSLGISGNKAQHADLTVELGFSSDMGVTNSRYPEEICEGQIQMEQGSMMGLSYDQLDISTEDMENVDLYMQSLGVPARRNVNDPEVKRGETLFFKAGCHLCHVTTLHTRPCGSTLLAGTQLPWLGNQTIHPYSDFLLHDMGSEIMGVGLNDNYVSGLARGNEWRTTPLWGVGLQEKVNGHTCFLHDGRARNFIEAIMWHGGEGEASKNKFRQMPRADRQALVRFLQSL